METLKIYSSELHPELIKAFKKLFNVTEEELRKPRGTFYVRNCRKMYFFFMRTYTRLSLNQIAEKVNTSQHDVVIYHCKDHHVRIKKNVEYYDMYNLVKKEIKHLLEDVTT